MPVIKRLPNRVLFSDEWRSESSFVTMNIPFCLSASYLKAFSQPLSGEDVLGLLVI